MSGSQVHPGDPTPAVVTQPAQYNTTGSGEVHVRPMRAEDADRVGQMLCDAFHDKFEHLAGGPGELPSLVEANQKYLTHLSDRYHRYLVAEVNGEPAGICQLKMYGEEFSEPSNFNWGNYLSCCTLYCRMMCFAICDEKPKDKKCYVEVLGVDARFRGKGIGKILLEQADNEARNMGCNMIYLHVTMTNRAIHLYERQGYKIVGVKDGCCCFWCSLGIRKFYIMEKHL